MNVSHATPHTEMLRLARLHPDYTLLQIFELVRQHNWQIEELSEVQTEAYATINALMALQTVRSVVDGHDSKYILNSPPRRRQWLPTGQHLHLVGLLDPATMSRLASSCDQFLGAVGSPPVSVADHQTILDTTILKSLAGTALSALPSGLPTGSEPVILKKRTILRRTFPPDYFSSSVGNANNQHWHQDSNMHYNDAPMLTLWLPLQECGGETRPGLQIIDSPASFFSTAHGDSSPSAFDFLVELFPGSRIVSVEASAGDCIAFNGLTFHQTWATAL